MKQVKKINTRNSIPTDLLSLSNLYSVDTFIISIKENK